MFSSRSNLVNPINELNQFESLINDANAVLNKLITLIKSSEKSLLELQNSAEKKAALLSCSKELTNSNAALQKFQPKIIEIKNKALTPEALQRFNSLVQEYRLQNDASKKYTQIITNIFTPNSGMFKPTNVRPNTAEQIAVRKPVNS